VDSIIWLAKGAAADSGYDTSAYDLVSVFEDSVPSGDSVWCVFFKHKPPGFPGGHFVVNIDKATNKATVSRGL
jgi:hypothetical protein